MRKDGYLYLTLLISITNNNNGMLRLILMLLLPDIQKPAAWGKSP